MLLTHTQTKDRFTDVCVRAEIFQTLRAGDLPNTDGGPAGFSCVFLAMSLKPGGMNWSKPGISPWLLMLPPAHRQMHPNEGAVFLPVCWLR